MPFVFVAYSTPRTYSVDRDWCSRDVQEHQGLTGCLLDLMCSANGPPTPGLRLQLAVNAANDVAFRHEQTLGRIQQLPNFGANSIQRRRATYDRFILTAFLCTLQRLTSTQGLIQPLQHSIPGTWLAFTQAGFTPASQADLASPHVRGMVILRSVGTLKTGRQVDVADRRSIGLIPV